MIRWLIKYRGYIPNFIIHLYFICWNFLYRENGPVYWDPSPLLVRPLNHVLYGYLRCDHSLVNIHKIVQDRDAEVLDMLRFRFHGYNTNYDWSLADLVYLFNNYYDLFAKILIRERFCTIELFDIVTKNSSLVELFEQYELQLNPTIVRYMISHGENIYNGKYRGAVINHVIKNDELAIPLMDDLLDLNIGLHHERIDHFLDIGITGQQAFRIVVQYEYINADKLNKYLTPENDDYIIPLLDMLDFSHPYLDQLRCHRNTKSAKKY